MTTPAANPADDAPHLLVVDDDRRIRALLLRFLLAEGYRVTTAETAREAARRFLAGMIDAKDRDHVLRLIAHADRARLPAHGDAS